MFSSMFSDAATKGLEQTVAFTERRHAILAGNVANMDTPGYKTRDLSVDDFQKNLKSLMDTTHVQSPGITPNMPSPGMLQFGQPDSNGMEPLAATPEKALEQVRDSMKQVLYHDDSDDSLEMQVTQISKNQSMHSMAIALLKSQYRSLQMAISGSVTA